MKYYAFLLSLLLLSTMVKAQKSPDGSYDIFPHFTENGGDFNSYIASHVKKPEVIVADLTAVLAITVDIDSTGQASIKHITPQTTLAPEIAPDIYIEFQNAIKAAPKWRPAKLKGKPVGYFFTSFYDVKLDKAAATINVNVHDTGSMPISSGDKTFTAVQVQPSFPGNENDYRDFLVNNIKYPKEAKRNNVTGRVFIQFIVEKDGSLTDFKILRDPGSGLGEEALRVMKLSPKWIPGRQNDKPVRVQFTVPINFSLSR